MTIRIGRLWRVLSGKLPSPFSPPQEFELSKNFVSYLSHGFSSYHQRNLSYLTFAGERVTGASVMTDAEGQDDLWVKLGRPRHVVAPMVDASELAWRLLSRRHGAQLCYSPMFHSTVFSKDPKYRREALATAPEDRPLIIQFCGNKPEVMVQAGKLAEPYCDAVDVNLGCPQAIAKRGYYGAFLQDDWDLLTNIVKALSENLAVPVTCKMRVFESVDKTVRYARMLEAAGCKLLTVHGRTREQKGPLTGIASWAHIKAVRENVKIPVFANGNIQCLQDVHRCLEETGCDGVMSAEGHLFNPCIFEGIHPPAWEPALEYLDIVVQHPCPTSYIRGHLFKLFHHLFALPENSDLREEVAKGSGIDEFKETILKIRERYKPVHEGQSPWLSKRTSFDLELPPWLCQPYVRISPEDHLKKMEEAQIRNSLKEKEKLVTGVDIRPRRKKLMPTYRIKNLQGGEGGKRGLEVNGEVLSKKKMKRMLRRSTPFPHSRREVQICCLCPNPVGLKCVFSMCKTCCRLKCYNEEHDCVGHQILVRTKRLKAREKAEEGTS